MNYSFLSIVFGTFHQSSVCATMKSLQRKCCLTHVEKRLDGALLCEDVCVKCGQVAADLCNPMN